MTNTIKYNNFTLKYIKGDDYGDIYKLITENGLEMKVFTDMNSLINCVKAPTLETKDVVERYERENYDSIQDAILKYTALTTLQNMANSGKIEFENDMYKKSITELVDIIKEVNKNK